MVFCRIKMRYLQLVFRLLANNQSLLKAEMSDAFAMKQAEELLL